MSEVAELQGQSEHEAGAGQEDVRERRKGRPTKLDAALVQRALDQARAELRARGVSGEPTDSAIHRLCTAPGETVPVGSRATLKALLAEIRGQEGGAPSGLGGPSDAVEMEGEGADLDLAGKIALLNPAVRQRLESLVDGAVSLSASAAAADTRSWNLEQEVTNLRRQLNLAQEDATRAADDSANALREARTRIEESETAYFETQDQLGKALDARRRLADLLGRMRDRWLTASGRAASAESQARALRAEVAEAHQLTGELTEKARQAEAAFRQMETQAAEAARLADTRIHDLAHQLQAATEGAATLRAELREAQTAVQIAQDRCATLQQERDRLLRERDEAAAAVRSAEAAKSAADLAAGVLQAQLDAANRARDKAEARADRLDAERHSGEPA